MKRGSILHEAASQEWTWLLPPNKELKRNETMIFTVTCTKSPWRHQGRKQDQTDVMKCWTASEWKQLIASPNNARPANPTWSGTSFCCDVTSWFVSCRLKSLVWHFVQHHLGLKKKNRSNHIWTRGLNFSVGPTPTVSSLFSAVYMYLSLIQSHCRGLKTSEVTSSLSVNQLAVSETARCQWNSSLSVNQPRLTTDFDSNDVIATRWQCWNLGYFGLIFIYIFILWSWQMLFFFRKPEEGRPDAKTRSAASKVKGHIIAASNLFIKTGNGFSYKLHIQE